MAKNVIVFDLKDEDDVDALVMKFERFVKALKGGEEKKQKMYEDENEPIHLDELCKRLKKKPPTIAAYRQQGMPYIAGKPCTYIYSECLRWLNDSRGIEKVQRKK
ncbi:hypothetical protein [Nafulsella turpanensis]|uniref:hypothetical protein n=1 Tax=Nafulsella turpanensis TaxID=1265690 RepID=UPI000344E23B|nr:hypothetical protein [Nafulsella turpanensis]